MGAGSSSGNARPTRSAQPSRGGATPARAVPKAGGDPDFSHEATEANRKIAKMLPDGRVAIYVTTEMLDQGHTAFPAYPGVPIFAGIAREIPKDLWLSRLLMKQHLDLNSFLDQIEQVLMKYKNHCAVASEYSVTANTVQCSKDAVNQVLFEWNKKTFWSAGIEADLIRYPKLEGVSRCVIDGIAFRLLVARERDEKMELIKLMDGSSGLDGSGLGSYTSATTSEGLSAMAPKSTSDAPPVYSTG